MSLQKIMFNFNVQKNGKITESLLHPNHVGLINPKGLKYVPSKQLTTDVVELAPKEANSLDLGDISKEQLQELIDSGFGLHKIAAKLNTKICRVRKYLEKYNISTHTQDEFNVLKAYFTATSAQEKAKAFEAVDKYLQKIAKAEAHFRKDIAYKDILQDVRLRFLEFEIECRKNKTTPRIIQIGESTIPEYREGTNKVNVRKMANKIGGPDPKIEEYEANDYMSYLAKNADLTPKEYAICKMLNIEKIGMPNAEARIGLTESSILKHYKNALEKIKQLHENTSSNEELSARSEFAQNVVNTILAR